MNRLYVKTEMFNHITLLGITRGTVNFTNLSAQGMSSIKNCNVYVPYHEFKLNLKKKFLFN